jgi:4-hydroxyphenylpyruvate dioxygenase
MDPAQNPMGTDGFEFIEYTAPDPQQLGALFEQMGFTAVARHRSKDVVLYRQGQVNFIVNREPDSFAQSFARVHGPSACAFAIRVKDAAKAYERALSLGAKPFQGKVGPMELNIPAIRGIGDSLIYLIDRYPGNGIEGDTLRPTSGSNMSPSIYDVDFVPIEGVPQNPVGPGLIEIDHLTHNVYVGRMDTWAQFYEKLFNFREIRYFDIKGKMTGLTSRALTSPCGKIRIPINEPSDTKSQIQEYLDAYNGEGIQHIALSTADIFTTVETLRARDVRFLNTPDTYYERVSARVKNHGEDLERMKRNRILLDGEGVDKDHHEDKLLQIFTETVIGPIFFEIIQRKGNQGFGEGNFRALFESIEANQIARGVI